MTNKRIELLAPAKDSDTACTAIQCGADAVYLGAPQFSAREAAGNALDTIAQVVAFAHPYYARVYVALNTLLRDSELASAERMIGRLCEIGIDGLIIQDVGLLELDLPPIPLIASTQMDNATPETVKFLEKVGFSRVILARELTLDQIRAIREQTSVELECFVHGAICVGASGQCYMSYAAGGRSGNRGQCAQPCRRRYTLKDNQGKILAQDRYLLSLKDLNLASHLETLIDAGVNSFKIEGRLKDIPYVANTVGFYRQELDAILTQRNLQRSSSGSVRLDFDPDPAKTFNRGFTDYGLTGPAHDIASMDTPKSLGEFVGTVTRVEQTCFLLDGQRELHNADGLCFFDRQNNLTGTVVNRVEGRKVYVQDLRDIQMGQKIYRNHDHAFARKLTDKAAQRKIHLRISLTDEQAGLVLSAMDEDGNEATIQIDGPQQPAQKKDAARQTLHKQLTRLGNTIFECAELELKTRDVYFMPASQLNAARRELIERLLEIREQHRPRLVIPTSQSTTPYPQQRLTYRGNVLNAKAKAFCHRHGVETIEPAAEAGLDMSGRLVMTTKYCLRRQLGLCAGPRAKVAAPPLILQDEDGRQYDVHFRCGDCGMDLFSRPGAKRNGSTT